MVKYTNRILSIQAKQNSLFYVLLIKNVYNELRICKKNCNNQKNIYIINRYNMNNIVYNIMCRLRRKKK